MSEPDNSRWLDQVSEELREEVPVHAAWRARLLAEIASAPRPAADDPDMRFEDSSATIESSDAVESSRGSVWARRIVLPPIAGLAAALAFAAIGAGAMYIVMARGGGDATGANNAGLASSRTDRGGASIPAADVTADESVVRFELSAPSATRVALVGSFNRWNPLATPLARDPATGTWTVSLRLPAGRHVYAFVVDGDVTADPAAPRAADADFGSANSVVLVSGRSS